MTMAHLSYKARAGGRSRISHTGRRSRPCKHCAATGTPSQRTMDRETLRQLLEWAEGQVDQAERFVAKHRMLVATLERAKGDTGEAKRLLAQLELCLKVHVAERNKLQWELWMEMRPKTTPFSSTS
jgi:hypothetical protein